MDQLQGKRPTLARPEGIRASNLISLAKIELWLPKYPFAYKAPDMAASRRPAPPRVPRLVAAQYKNLQRQNDRLQADDQCVDESHRVDHMQIDALK